MSNKDDLLDFWTPSQAALVQTKMPNIHEASDDAGEMQEGGAGQLAF